MLQANYEIWEKFDKDRKFVCDMVGALQSELAPLKKDLKEVEDFLSKISTYRINDLFDTVKKISECHGKNAEMVKFLVENFKHE
jgi:hypothetical protein